MPETLRIGVFVFGAVLILVFLIGGNFKIFGAEVASTVSNPILRFFALAFGTIFIVIAIYGNYLEEKDVSQSSSLPTPTPTPSSTSVSTPTPTSSATSTQTPERTLPEQPIDISGVWRNSVDTANSTIIEQTGQSFSYSGSGVMQYGPQPVGFKTAGTGKLTLNRISMEYQASYQVGMTTTGTCNGTVSPDANRIQLQCFDSQWGPSTSLWTRD